MKLVAAILVIVASTVGLVAATPVRGLAASDYRDVIMADNPMMYWRLGESGGGLAYDETANHRDAAYMNYPFLRLEGAIQGDSNTAAGFNGADQYVIWNPSVAYYYPFSVEAWVRLRRVSALATIFDTRSQIGEYSFDLKFDTQGGQHLHFDVGDGQTWLTNAEFDFAFTTGVWYYVAATVTSTGATAYVDGTAIGSVTYSGFPYLFSAEHPVQIGTNTRYDNEWFHGKIDEVAVYGYALSADQVMAHYQAGL